MTVHADSSGRPGTVLTTLSGANPISAGQYTYTCTAVCNLAAHTDYFVQVSALAGATHRVEWYSWISTWSDTEVLVPADNGWSIADALDFNTGGTWQEFTDVPKLKIDATTR